MYRTRICAKETIRFFGPRKAIPAIQRSELYALADYITKETGRSSGTARKTLSMYFAMCRFNVREGKFEKFAEIPLPKGGPPRTRSFTQEEVALVWRQDMPLRTRLFFLLDFGTAARSRAIEEAKVGNVDWDRRIIDYRHPGVDYKKKRRGEVALSDWVYETLRELVFARGPRHPDEYLIGNGKPRPGRKTIKGPTSTYHACCQVLAKVGLKEKWVARHVGRKTWATEAQAQGLSHLQIGAVLHDTVTTLEKHYIFPRADQAHPLMNRVPMLPAPT